MIMDAFALGLRAKIFAICREKVYIIINKNIFKNIYYIKQSKFIFSIKKIKII